MFTLSQTFNLSKALKIVKLKTLCIPVSAIQVCLNVSQKYRLYKQIETLRSTSVPKLTPGYFTGVYVINLVTILIASIDMSKCLNIRYRKT